MGTASPASPGRTCPAERSTSERRFLPSCAGAGRARTGPFRPASWATAANGRGPAATARRFGPKPRGPLIRAASRARLGNGWRVPLADLFAECLAFTLAQEGGYVDDPYDPGGATNMGITLATLRQWDHDSALGPDDVRHMTQQTAAS